MKRFFESAAFLAVCGLIAKVIGALYKVPLVTVLGAEGIGVYQLVFPTYTTLLTLASGGIPQAVSRSTARALAVGNKKESKRILAVSLLSLTGIGLVGTILMAVCGNLIAGAQGNALASASYLALSPSVLLVSMLAALRGWWQGHSNMFPTAVSQLIEQMVKLGAGLWLAAMLMPYGLEYGVMGAVIGITVSELLALAALGIGLIFRKVKGKRVKTASGDANDAPAEKGAKLSVLLADVYKSALPISFGSLVLPLLQLIDSVMIVNILVRGGMSTPLATSLYGIAGAPVSAIVNLPTVVTAAVAAALMPKFAACLKKGQPVKKYADEGMKYAHIVGIGGSVMLCLFADELLTALYSGGLTGAQIALAASILRITSVSVAYICYMQVITTYLQAQGKAYVPALNLLFGGAIKAALTALLLITVGIEGSAIATVCAYVVTFALDVFAARKGLRGIELRPFLTVAASVVAASAVGFSVKLLPISSSMLAALVRIGAFGVTYLMLLALTKTVHIRDILPPSSKISAEGPIKKSKKY